MFSFHSRLRPTNQILNGLFWAFHHSCTCFSWEMLGRRTLPSHFFFFFFFGLHSCLDEKNTLRGETVSLPLKWNVLKEKYFQPSLMFIDSGTDKRWHTHAPNTTVKPVMWGLRVHSAPAICCSLRSALPTNHRTAWAELQSCKLGCAAFFPLIKVPSLK